MTRVFFAALTLGLILMLGLSSLVRADAPCLALSQFLAALDEKYSETPRMSGLAGNQLLVVTASDSGTWTALMVQPDGTACLAAAGEAFVLAPPVIPGALN